MPVERIYQLNIERWDQSITPTQQQQVTAALEAGKVVYLPNLPFKLLATENCFLSPAVAHKKRKNISYNSEKNSLGFCNTDNPLQLTAFMQRFVTQANQLVQNLLPYYESHLTLGRTSYRPVEIDKRNVTTHSVAGNAHIWAKNSENLLSKCSCITHTLRFLKNIFAIFIAKSERSGKYKAKGGEQIQRNNLSWRKDDTRLHVDAFPSTPMQGSRILRLFTNINPHQQNRVWRLGEPFEQVVKNHFPRLKQSSTLQRKLLHLLHTTKKFRTPYDDYMLQLHDSMKADLVYQRNVDQITFEFPPNSSWLVFTDIASHAAMSGQYLLEQTFYLPYLAMQNPDLSPLAILQNNANCQLL